MLIYLQMIDTPEDRHKLEIIYQEYRKLMFHIAKKILNNNEDAEDVVHQSFLVIAENIMKIGDPLSSKTKGYVLIIAEHKAIDMLRRNNYFSYVSLDRASLCKAIEYCKDDTLSKCILKLPSNYRHVILLKYHQGYSSKEIAKILGISEANAIKLDQRAKNKLRELCREEELL